MDCNKSVCVVGLGYIGLPTAALLATKGFQVLGCDISEYAVSRINRGEIHIVENDLDILVKSAVGSGHLKAFTSPQKADIYILAVPTPFKNDFEPDLSYVKKATEAIAAILRPGNLIILESTSPVGTTDQISQWLIELRPDLNIPLTDIGAVENSSSGEQVYIAHCPERVLPGQIIRELVENDRIIGGIGKKSGKMAASFYETFVTGNVFVTNARTAEMAKLTENAYRDVNIAFANELANICSDELIDVHELISLANRHPRVNILNPGIGVGGHCLAVDPWFIVDKAKEKAALIKTARKINDARPKRVVEAISNVIRGQKGLKILCLGLAYKPDIDDLRESPAMEVASALIREASAEIYIIEPNIKVLPQALMEPVLIGNCSAEGVTQPELLDISTGKKDFDLVVLLVKHKEFTSDFLGSFNDNARIINGACL